GHQLVHTDGAALGEQPVDVADVDDLVLGAEPVAESLELGQPHVDGHLPTLEGHRHILAGLGALGAAARGLAFRAVTTADAGAGCLRAARGPQVVQLDRHFASPPAGSTATRCRTTAISPRVCGLSSRITECRIRLRPSVRRLSRCFQRAPMVLRTWVIFSWLMAASPVLRPRPALRFPGAP